MLSETDINLVEPLAISLSECDYRLVPVNNTPLYELSRLSYDGTMPADLYSKSFTEILANDNQANYKEMRLLEMNSEHGQLQDQLIDMLSKSLTRQINFIRTEIVPEIESIYTAVSEQVATGPKRISSSIIIVQKDIPTVCESGLFVSAVNDLYAGARPVTPMDLPWINGDVLNSGIKDGDNSIQISDYVRDFYSTDRSGIYKYLCSIGNDDITYCIRNPLVESIGQYERLQEAVIRLLVFDALKANNNISAAIYPELKPEGVMGYINSVRAYCGPMILLLMDQLDKITSYGDSALLVTSFDRKNKTINVNGPVYREWISKENDNKVLYGMLVDDTLNPINYNVSAVNSLASKYISYWDKYVVLEEANIKYNNLNYFKDYLRMTFFSSLGSTRADFEKEYEECTPGTIEHIKERFNSLISKVEPNDIDTNKSLHATITKIVALSRYYYTDAYRILSYMVSEAKENTEENDPAELATIAIIHYLTDYFIEQISTIKG